MSFRYIYTDKPGYLLVKPEGQPTSYEELGDNAEEMFHKASQRKSKYILIDWRGAKLDFEAIDLVNVSNYLDERDLQFLGVRVAALVDSDNASVFHKLETSLTIRAFSYRVFGHKDEALAWLGAIA